MCSLYLSIRICIAIVISSSVCIACNEGWFRFENTCYTVAPMKSYYLLAETYCRNAGGSLALVNSSEVIQFLQSMQGVDGKEEYWVHKDSSSEDNSTSEIHGLCSYMVVTEIKSEYCEQSKYFICEYEDRTYSCPTGFTNYTYESGCYEVVVRKANYTTASTYCSHVDAQLAILDSLNKEMDARYAIVDKNETFLIDAKLDEGNILWGNEKEFDISTEQSTEEGEGECIGLQSHVGSEVIFSWIRVNCSKTFAFICQTNHITTTTPLPTTSTTTEEPLVCPHGPNWKTHEESGSCFWETSFETTRLNWFDAQEFCRRYGGDLATYENEGQENYGVSQARGLNSGLWIGLKRDENDVFHWVDDTSLTYYNWELDEPDLSSKSKYCVTHAGVSSQWRLDYCGVRRWFVCKSPKIPAVRALIKPDTTIIEKTDCKFEGVSVHRNSWVLYKDVCYLALTHVDYTWDLARGFCQNNGGYIASIHSFEETNFILNLISSYVYEDFWIGLQTSGIDTQYSWYDESPVDFVYWADNKKDEDDGPNTCVFFNKKDGSWNTDHCNNMKHVICKRGRNSNYVFPTPEPTSSSPGGCQKDWYTFGNMCYKSSGFRRSTRVPWAKAKESCESMNATLVSIHSQEEQDFLTFVVLETRSAVWIGMQRGSSYRRFDWTDESRVDYTNWGPSYSSDYSCVYMDYSKGFIGKWYQMSCLSRLSYICKKKKDPALTTEYQDPFACPEKEGWLKLGNSCYGLFENEEVTWQDAQRKCRLLGASLTSFRNMAVEHYLSKELQKVPGWYWIGVRAREKNKFILADGHTLQYSNWMPQEPRQLTNVLDTCVATNENGSWSVKSCKEEFPYICELELSKDNDEFNFKSACNNKTDQWIDLGGESCYLLKTDSVRSWSAAQHYCFIHGGNLASFHSEAEVKRFLRYLTTLEDDAPTFHIGLGKKKDGGFGWIDRSPVDYVAWDDDEPDFPSNYCTSMSGLSGLWSDADCDTKLSGFVCSSPKLAFSDDLVTENSTSEEERVRQKLTAGGIFGIIICILVVSAIIGLVIYYLRPRKDFGSDELEPEPLL